jgi:hypothetical protein
VKALADIVILILCVVLAVLGIWKGYELISWVLQHLEIRWIS